MEESSYRVTITVPAKNRYQDEILPYLHTYFSFDRAIEIDQNIIASARSLANNPERGRVEDNLKVLNKDFRFILFH